MEKPRTSVALGLFDGVHLGHRAVLAQAASQKDNGLVPAAFTFEPATAHYKPDSASGHIYPMSVKSALLEECGAELIYAPAFSEVRTLPGRDFVREILLSRMNAAHVVCGGDFHFGAGASCGADELMEFGRQLGFTVQTVPEVRLDGAAISSSRIRSLLTEGDTAQANVLLGEPYRICSAVVRGAQLGRTIGFPTANQIFDEGQLIPLAGVYASETLIGGKWLPSMTDVGMKPTVGYTGRPLAETYIDGFSGDLYGTVLTVRLLRFIRPEKKFSSVEELRAQIAADTEKCR